MWFGDGMGWWMLFGGIWMIVFWGAIIALVIWVIKKLTERPGSGTGTGKGTDPLTIAKERYARGEINREEFEQLRKDLS